MAQTKLIFKPRIQARRTSPPEHKLDDLCLWIENNLGESIGWQQLMTQSGLEFQTIQTLFFKYKNTTPMTWIRGRREAKSAPPI